LIGETNATRWGLGFRKLVRFSPAVAMIRAMHGRTILAAVLAAIPVLGCEKPPIAWSDPTAIAQPDGAHRLAIDRSGRVAFTIDSLRPVSPPEAPGACRATLVEARALTRLFASWWKVRPDSSSELYIAASQDSGKTWGRPFAVDTTDVSSAGCTRPPPSLATVGDDVYVAYSMIAPEGKGVFFAHTMGSMLHSPVPVIYGERLVSTAIAADADRVLVAYEEPNGTHPQIDVALSMTQGHIFEVHSTASRDVDDATTPAVAFNGPLIAVSWVERRAGSATSTRVARAGRIQ
jgi:hypothetical protein